MNEIIIKDLIKVLKKSIPILETENKDYFLLRELSNNTIHNASIFQDHLSITCAIILYSIYKICNRQSHVRIEKFKVKIISEIQEMIDLLSKENLDAYENKSKELMNYIKEFDHETSQYIQQIIEKAKITKGSKLYSHGISLQQTAAILDINLWQLKEYIGHTNVSEEEDKKISPLKRLQIAEELFNVK